MNPRTCVGEKSKNRHKPYTVLGHLIPVGALTYHLIVGQAFQPPWAPCQSAPDRNRVSQKIGRVL